MLRIQRKSAGWASDEPVEQCTRRRFFFSLAAAGAAAWAAAGATAGAVAKENVFLVPRLISVHES